MVFLALNRSAKTPPAGGGGDEWRLGMLLSHLLLDFVHGDASGPPDLIGYPVGALLVRDLLGSTTLAVSASPAGV
jgi:hypothetical protein